MHKSVEPEENSELAQLQAENMRLRSEIAVMRIPLEEIWRRWANEPANNECTVVSYVWSSKGERETKAALSLEHPQ